MDVTTSDTSLEDKEKKKELSKIKCQRIFRKHKNYRNN
jgi:hypothetical protein